MRIIPCLILLSLLAGLAVAESSDTTTSGCMDSSSTSLKTLKVKRQQAANRKRRIIFNNDGDDAVLHPRAATAQELLASRTTPLIGSQVDSIFYSTHGSFGSVKHRTKVGQGPSKEKVHPKDITYDLIQQGTDSLQIMVDYCHKNKIEIFWSMRMNDTHDGLNYEWAPKIMSQLKRDHPEFLIGSKNNLPKHGFWTAIDYTHTEVRELAYRLAEEVCQNYDIDGIELDFFRFLLYFKSVAYGGQASDEELAGMTQLIRDIRAMTEAEGLRRGRPILVAIRVPDSVGYCRGIGLDVEKWLAEGLADILIPGGDFQLNPWETSVALGHKYGVKVYADLDPCTSVSLSGPFNRNAMEVYRSRAMSAWQAGMDGIYIYNHFNPRTQLWRELGDAVSLQSMDKIYFPNVTGRLGWHRADQFLANGERFRGGPALHPDTPQFLFPGKPYALFMTIGDDVAWGKEKGIKADIQCHLNISGLSRADQVQVQLNGKSLTSGTLKGGWLVFPVSSEIVKQGINRFDVTFNPQTTTQATGETWDMAYQCDHMLVYPSQLPWRRLFSNKNGVEKIENKTLLLADRGQGEFDIMNLIYPWPIRPEDETILEVRVKVISSQDPLGVCIRVSNGKTVDYLTLELDKISLKFAGIQAPVKTTDDFHTYRIIFKNNSIKVYVDNRLALDGSGKFTTPVSDAKTKLKFPDVSDDWPNKCSLLVGSASGPGTGEAYWEFIRYRTETRLFRDLVLPIRYVIKK